MAIKKDSEPLVSVVVPGYNHAPYLRKRIDSILGQTYGNIEVILMDDCSPDNSADIMLSYEGHPKVSHVVINEKNTGNTFIQWQRGIDLCRGTYVWIAESDDVADIHFVEKLMEPIVNFGAEIAFSYSRLIDQNDNILPKDPNRTWLYMAPGIYEGDVFVVRRLALANLVFNASMVIWSKKCYQNISRDFANYRHCGDWLFWFEMCRGNKIAEVPEYLNFFRQHPQKVTVDAANTGDSHRETAPIQQYILGALHASSYQRRVVRGRCSKRIKKEVSPSVIKELQSAYPDIYNASCLDTLCYVFDKMTNLSGYQYSKR